MRRKPSRLVFLTAVVAKPEQVRTDLVRLQYQLDEGEATRRHESQSLFGLCWASWIRSRPRWYSRQRIVDASTYKQNLVNLLFSSSSFMEASSMYRYSNRTTSRFGFHTVEDWLLERRFCRYTYRHTCTTVASSECCCPHCGRCHIAHTCQRYYEVITLAPDLQSDSFQTLCAYARRSQRNQFVVSSGHDNTDLVIARTSSASFRNDYRIRHPSHHDTI